MPIALAFVFGLILTGVAIPLARLLGQTDRPDGRRKLHVRPVPVVGGVALFVGVVAALAVGWAVFPFVKEAAEQAGWAVDFDLTEVISTEWPQAMWLLASAALMVTVGVLDDRWQLRARFKLVGQIAAILPAVYGGGCLIQKVTVFGVPLEFGMFAVPLTVLWFLAAVNAINLLDGMDGMLGTLGAIVCAALGLMAVLAGNWFAAVVAFALVGGLGGFLWYNRPPAKVYMGDAGSTLIGLLVAALSIRYSMKGAGAAVAILAPVGLLVLPFLDTTAAIIRRTLTGRGIAAADRGHLHHLLQKRGLSTPQVLLVVGSLGALAATGAILAAYWQRDEATQWKGDAVAVVAACGVIALLLARGLFGLAEVRLLASRVRAVVAARVSRPHATEEKAELQGGADWEVVWARVMEAATELSLTAVHLDVNAPVWHLGYHRRWKTRDHSDDRPRGWRVDLPLSGYGQAVGRLTLFGQQDDGTLDHTLRAAGELAHEVEALIATVVAPLADPAGHTPTPVLTAESLPAA